MACTKFPKKMKSDYLESQPVKELVLPRPHYIARLIRANTTYMLAGRGTFKTSRGIALFVIDMVYEMPGSTGVLVGLSFEHIGDNTLPPLLQAFEEFGFRAGEHFVVGKKPPKEWPRPYLGVINEKYDHVISFHNGTIIYLVSLVKKASANGVSAQWGAFDEVKFMNERELIDEIFPIFRGNEETKRRFQRSSGYLAKFFATDKLADPAHIKWLLKKRKQQRPDIEEVIIELQLHLNDLRVQYETAGENKRQKLRPVIADLELRLSRHRANLVHVAEVSANDVLYAHGDSWLNDKRRNTKQREFDVAYGNKDPDKPGESFYPDYNEAVHVHHIEGDVNPDRGFIFSADYQHSIAPILIAQLGKLPGFNTLSLNYIDNLYAMPEFDMSELSPEELLQVIQGELREATELFCNKYRNHPTKKVYYVFDQTATGRRVNADQFFILVKKILRRNGWKVIEVYTGEAPEHYMKHQDCRDWFTESDPSAPAIRIHARCTKLRASITGASARTINGKTKKDKKDEQNSTLNQSETTHFSDVFDMINHAVLKLKMIRQVNGSGKVALRG